MSFLPKRKTQWHRVGTGCSKQKINRKLCLSLPEKYITIESHTRLRSDFIIQKTVQFNFRMLKRVSRNTSFMFSKLNTPCDPPLYVPFRLLCELLRGELYQLI